MCGGGEVYFISDCRAFNCDRLLFAESGVDPTVHGAQLEDRFYNNKAFEVRVIGWNKNKNLYLSKQHYLHNVILSSSYKITNVT